MDPYILRDLEEIAPDLLDTLRERGLTLSTAESCTGGNIAHHLTLVPGCSDILQGGAVTYSNRAKSDILGVDPAVIEANGAVSEPVVRAMALGACKAFRTAAVTPSGTVSEVYHLSGPRAEIIDKATLLALRLLINAL